MDGTDNNMRAYMEALEEERRKIQVFQRELPLCMELATQAIEACKKQLKETGLDSEITEKTSEEGPVLEEFIPIRRDSSSDVDEVVDADTDDDEHHSQSQIDKDKKKSDWLRSVSLWNPNPDMPLHVEEATPEKLSMGEMKDPTQKETSDGKSNQSSDRLTASPSGPATTTSSSAGTAAVRAGGVAGKRSDDKKAPTPRKQRRCWSPELHRRFVHALQHLGGSHATPKQIRELMKVDGLTNDEVKSHLQKYRLHTRRPNPPSNSGSVQQPQFVVVGGIWVPPTAAPTAMDAATSLREAASLSMLANNRIYAPVAAPATVNRTQQRQSSRVSNTVEREKLAESKSAATSRSTHTVTVC